MKLKKIVALMSTISLMSTFGVSLYASADDNSQKNLCKLGYVSSIEDQAISENVISSNYLARTQLPSSVDLSLSPCFPPIIEQKYLGSCSSIATTYYQFSYEVNKLNDVTSTTDRVIYSPKWTYNLVNNGVDEGADLTSNYNVLKNLGALKNSDFEYTGYLYDYTEWPSQMKEEKIEALETRVENVNSVLVSDTVGISAPTATVLNPIKSKLNEGKVFVATTKCMFNSLLVNGESVVYRTTPNEDGEHAVTIVGYDDTKCCDVNNNGTIEECEKGAFKVANSWGKSFNEYGIQSNTGYFWVLYDALNRVSTNTYNDWESKLTGERYPAFSTDNYSNRFYSIDVEHKDVYLLGEISINTSDRESLGIKINRNQSTSWEYLSQSLKPYVSKNDGRVLAFNGTIYFDYDSYAEPISTYYNGYNWWLNVENTSENDSVIFSILDNHSNAIKSTNTMSKTGDLLYTYYDIDLTKGDLNYDGQIDLDDANILIDYKLDVFGLSNMQYFLGDLNNDGEVSIADISILQKLVSSVSTKAYINNFVYSYNNSQISQFERIR